MSFDNDNDWGWWLVLVAIVGSVVGAAFITHALMDVPELIKAYVGE